MTFLTVPINCAEILAHSISQQKEQVAKYKGYLEALVKMKKQPIKKRRL